MKLTTNLLINPQGGGGADFDIELVPGQGSLLLSYNEAQFTSDARAALEQMAHGFQTYAAEPEEKFGRLPSAVFTATKLHGETTPKNIPRFRLAGIIAARDFHKRTHAAG